MTYFPKFGVGYGKAEFMEVAKGLLGSLQRIEHDFDRMTFHVARDHVIVEGFEGGVMADGTAWPVEGRSEGRCAPGRRAFAPLQCFFPHRDTEMNVP